MGEISTTGDAGHEMRREINALHGLLCFSHERRYPEGITRSLREMLTNLEVRLFLHEQATNARNL